MQTSIFDNENEKNFDLPEHPQSLLGEKLLHLSKRGVYWGTSSWKYESWWEPRSTSTTKLYTHPYPTKKEFEHRSIEEYSSVFPMVGGDFSFYNVPTEKLSTELATQTPEHFRFLLKATDVFTIHRYPVLKRFGALAGKMNPDFLNPKSKKFETEFLKGIEPLGKKCGLIVFEFTAFDEGAFISSSEFLEKLIPFFKAIPELKATRYGIEIRNKELLDKKLLQGLKELNLVPVLNSWTRMPPLDMQWSLAKPFGFDFICVRAMNKPGRTHQEAETRFDPYDKIRQRNQQVRNALAEIQNWTLHKSGRTSYLITNNHLEGCSFQTIREIVMEEGKS